MSESKTKSADKVGGYHSGSVDTVISVEEVTRQAEKIAEKGPSNEKIAELARNEPFVFTNIFGGSIMLGDGDEKKDITRLSSSEKLKKGGIAYILQDKSIFPDMTVEENLWMGGYLKDRPELAKEAAEQIFSKYSRLAERRKKPAKVLSGGERRLLEISRALVMQPDVLLVDEPSIGLEPRFIDMVFEILQDLQEKEGKTIIMVEQNAKKGLEFADIGYVLVSGNLALAGSGDELLANPAVGRLFLGG